MINPFKPGDIVRTTRGWGSHPETSILLGDIGVVTEPEDSSPVYIAVRLFRYPHLESLFRSEELELVHEETD